MPYFYYSLQISHLFASLQFYNPHPKELESNCRAIKAPRQRSSTKGSATDAAMGTFMIWASHQCTAPQSCSGTKWFLTSVGVRL